MQTHLSLVVAKGYAERAHGPDDGHERLYSVAVHHGLVLLVVFRGEPALVDNPAHRQRTSGQHFVMTKSNATIPVRSYRTTVLVLAFLMTKSNATIPVRSYKTTVLV